MAVAVVAAVVVASVLSAVEVEAAEAVVLSNTAKAPRHLGMRARPGNCLDSLRERQPGHALGWASSYHPDK